MRATTLKNDGSIEAMRTEYVRLYAPTTTWGNIVSMHICLPKLLAYWPMSSIDEDFRVTDISGQGRSLSCFEYNPD
jgi:hypothetical protein